MASNPAGPPPGLLEGVRLFLGSWVALLRTRVELISAEIEEQREWLEQLVLIAVAAMFCLSLGVLLLTLFIVVLFWENGRLWVLGGFSVLYLGGGLLLFGLLRTKIKTKPRIFAATSAELAKDQASLVAPNP
jgi:uncharacterized membrane protein YqjE